jgi:regulator of CtrA degradation
MAEAEALMEDGVVETIAFGRQFASSDAFKALFRDGMGLVEEAAAYLDGEGREHSRRLPRLSALTYANESMRLTTRLMQMASWLLVQRSIAEGEMSAGDGLAQLSKMRMHRNEPPLSAEHGATLPETLVLLIEKSIRLQSRIRHLDGVIHAEKTDSERLSGRNAVALQHMLLKSAFGAQKSDHA